MADAKPNGLVSLCLSFEVFLFLFSYICLFFFNNIENFALNLDTKITSNYRS